MPSNIISNVVTVNFTLSGNATSSGSATALMSSTSGADILTVGAGSFLLGALAAFLF